MFGALTGMAAPRWAAEIENDAVNDCFAQVTLAWHVLEGSTANLWMHSEKWIPEPKDCQKALVLDSMKPPQ